MHRHVVAALAVASALACAERAEPTAPITLTVYGDAALSDNANGQNFGAHLSPKNETPPGPVNASKAVGNAVFQLSDDGQTLSYKLIVANIENAFMAHIHRGKADQNGPIVVWLYPSTAATPGPTGQGRIQGVIAQGSITKSNFVGELLNMEMSDLLALIANENAYVNVHTSDGVAPANTGPGDFPAGELRAQLLGRGQR